MRVTAPRRVVLFALAAIAAGTSLARGGPGAQSYVGRYFVSGYAEDGHHTTGTVTIELARAGYRVTRQVETYPQNEVYDLSGSLSVAAGSIRIDVDGTVLVSGVTSSLAQGHGTYAPDGHGALVGNYVGSEGTLVETLTPVSAEGPGDAAAAATQSQSVSQVAANGGQAAGLILSAVNGNNAPLVDGVVLDLDQAGALAGAIGSLAASQRDALVALPLSSAARIAVARGLMANNPGNNDAHLILGMAQAEQAKSLEDLRAFVSGLVSACDLYSSFGCASSADAAALEALALAVSPVVPVAEENAGFGRAFASLTATQWGSYAYDCLIVPGYTPDNAQPLHEIDPEAAARCQNAASDWKAGKAPFIITTGGSVHPENTRIVEGLELKAQLVAYGVPADHICVEPYARHSTTNLRNAGRVMLALGMTRGLIVTTVDQSFYFSFPVISTFDFRCLADLGYTVGTLSYVDLNRTAFTPGGDCTRTNPSDPFDP
jgi:hypothetical protein